MRTSNPILNEDKFKNRGLESNDRLGMTVNGTVNKTIILLLLIVASASFSWNQFSNGQVSDTLLFGSVIGAFVLVLITSFNPKTATWIAPIYAILEGYALGVISSQFNHLYDGIVIQAVLLTIGTCFAMLFAYKSRIIKVNDKFIMGVVAATFGIALVYLIEFVLNLCGVNIPFLHSTGSVGILVSLVVIVVAALNLVLDFHFIEQNANADLPKYMEWFSALGLVVTLVWLYLEFLRLLSKLRK